ncbi:TPA: hypothetical protein LUL88_004395 [Escherichia coli]|nr:hypothetical protein [Escherichia coli]
MIRLEHTGACMITFRGVNYMPGEFIEVEEINAGLKSLIAEGRLQVDGDAKATKEIIAEVKSKSKRKKPKTIDEAQTGQEYK